MKKPEGAKKRRERAEINETDFPRILRDFGLRIERMKESSESFDSGDPPLQPGSITVTFQIKGGFGSANDLFNAMRVAAGYYLPRKDTP